MCGAGMLVGFGNVRTFGSPAKLPDAPALGTTTLGWSSSADPSTLTSSILRPHYSLHTLQPCSQT
eukprot:2411210-Amphidinium_carterae.1